MSQDAQCGLCGIFPKWLQNRATPKVFIIVYGLLGTVQSMAFVYVLVTLTTLEKRFKIPSRTTGIILSGNEISQILSLFLIYYGGSGHRPRWIAVGVALSAVSCIVLALPHVIYGPGKDALALTQEYLDQNLLNATVKEDLPTCDGNVPLFNSHCDEESVQDISILPRLLIFLSQFILGIGTTLYYGLGQAYLDDNTKKKNTPMLLGFTFALRTLGPVVGFALGYACLSLYIDPALHPLITKEDPRWLGAWWLGWIILGTTMGMFAVFIAMFPRHLPKPGKSFNQEGEVPLKYGLNLPRIENDSKMDKSKESSKFCQITREIDYEPNMEDFLISMKQLMTNPILTCNNLSAVFYILGASVYMTFMTKYMEVLFGISAAGSSMISGPVTLISMILGFLVSGAVISKYKPSPRILLGWNVIIGVAYIVGEAGFLFLSCPETGIRGIDPNSMQTNLISACNSDCGCAGVKYSPVCHEPTMTTFFSACHAGCKTVLPKGEFGNCSCINDQINIESEFSTFPLLDKELYSTTNIMDIVKPGKCKTDCKTPFLIFTAIMCLIQLLTCSGKIGNVLVNYRSVEERHKSFAQGITLMMISLFALIPGPIIYGAVIDSTCLVWDDFCGMKGNCWVYDPDKFRNYINSTAVCFTTLGVLFDVGVWYLAKNVDLYGSEEEKRREFVKSLCLEETRKSEVDKNKYTAGKYAKEIR